MDKDKKKKKILLWYWGRKGGAARQTLEEAKAFSARDDVELYVSLCKENELYKETLAYSKGSYNVSIFPNKIKLIFNMLMMPLYKLRFKGFLEHNEIDLVYCVMGHFTTTYIAPVITKLGIDYYFTIHDAVNHPGEEKRGYTKSICKNNNQATKIIVHSNHVKNILISQYNIPEKKIIFIPLGAYSYNSNTVGRVINCDNPIHLLFFGRIEKYKGLGLTIKVHQQLVRQGYETFLDIYGSGDLSEYQEIIKNDRTIGIINRWIFDNEVENIFSKSDIVLLTYIEASQSGVVEIAANMGVPVVATPVGGLKEQVNQLECGIISESLDIDAICSACIRIINDTELYQKLSQNGIEASQKDNSWGTIIEGLLDK